MALRPINGERRSAAIRTEDASLDGIRDQVRTAINALQAIQDDANVTNTEVVQYIKQEALILQRLIRVIVGQVT
jgi:hypothetical protein